MYKKIKIIDPIIESAINGELQRQKEHIELIASENYVSDDVMIAQGSVLTNKYGEGYPAKRYYGSCQNVDIVEQTAIDRLKKLFNVKFANVQPYSGSVANAAAIASITPQGGKIMGLSLKSGGHLTHGYKISFSGIFYDAITYEVNDDGLLDYDAIEKIAIEQKPNLIICGYSAYSRTINFKRFREIADKVNAKLMADVAHIAGLIVAGEHPSPVNYAHIITSTTHKTLRGGRGGVIMTNDEEIAKKIDRWVFPGYQGGPLFHAIAGKAVAFYEALQPMFKIYAKNIVKNAKIFAQAFLNKGRKVISNGTDNHLFMVDVFNSYQVTGKQAEMLLEKINITINKNSIPNDTMPPMVTSGIRLGTAAMTSRDFTKWDELADIIDYALSYHNELVEETELAAAKILELKNRVLKLTKEFPIKNHYL